MRRGLLKDLANTPTQIARGWRMYGDLAQMRTLAGAEVVIDLLSGTSTVDGRELSPRLELAEATARWMDERLRRDGVPEGTVTAATLTLRPRLDRASLIVECATSVSTASAIYDSSDTVRWHPDDPGNR